MNLYVSLLAVSYLDDEDLQKRTQNLLELVRFSILCESMIQLDSRKIGLFGGRSASTVVPNTIFTKKKIGSNE